MMIGTLISHYKILEKLGEGGMGVVYKAHDTKLERVVALKFPPQALTADPEERERFYQEARSASQLLHPNVCTIFEINESEKQIYIAMEYVDGPTLKKRIQADNPMPLGKSLDIAIQICNGLVAAHEKGIVHRDIKSENILLTARGEVKITDFGLAKLKGAEKLTKTGSTLGTAAYMSPEQARGEDVDARSDIFSCGVVLYELFAGRLPFRGEHQAAILYSLVNEEPAPLARFNEHVSPDLQHIVSKALAKDREDRYQHADEMLADLRRERKRMEYARTGVIIQPKVVSSTQEVQAQEASDRSGGTKRVIWGVAGAVILLVAAGIYLTVWKPGPNQSATNSAISKIAVLPFENIGPSDKEYFADGLTDEIRTKLSGLSNLAVIARASSMQYKKTTKSISEIGTELSVGYLLQGTIRWEEGGSSQSAVHLLVNPSLVKITDGTQVWSQSFEGTLSSVFQMQSDIAQQVARALEVALNPSDQQVITSRPTNNAEAYDYFLQGQQKLYLPTSADMKEALPMFEKAIKLDPKFVAAYADLSRAYAFATFQGMSPDSLLVLSKKSLDKVKELEPNSFLANWSEGYYYYYGFRDYDQALRHFTTALNLQPNNVDIISAIGYVKRRQGKFQESRDLLARSCDLDPQAWRNWFELGYVELVMRQYPLADEHMKRALLVFGKGNVAVAAYHSQAIFSMNGDVRGAQELFDREAGENRSWLYKMRSAQLHLAGGNVGAAINDLSRAVLSEPDVDSTVYYMFSGLLHEQSGPRSAGRAYFDSARILAERTVHNAPNQAVAHMNLGIILAHLGQKARAIEEGEKGVRLMPLEKDALDEGPNALYELAQIYALTGESDAAIDKLEQILSIPNMYSVYFVQSDQELASLATLPRFQKLLEKYKTAR